MAYCENCGLKINDTARFCPGCGSEVRTNNIHENHERKVFYDGEVKKCPNCGEILKSFTPNCPTCGYELRNSKTTNYILDFSRKLEAASTSKQKDDLIRHFVMPNTKEDIYEFMILAAANLEANSDNSDAWYIKIEHGYQKSRIIFGDSPEFKIIEDIYTKAIDNYNKIKKKKNIASIGMFFKQHTKGIVLSILGIIAIIMLVIMVIGVSKENYSLIILFAPIIALGTGIAIAASDWKKK